MPDITDENLQIEILLNDIYEKWGYDFRDYSKASLKRRIKKIMILEHLDDIEDLSLKVLNDITRSSTAGKVKRGILLNGTMGDTLRS